jgi:hypothetical protein
VKVFWLAIGMSDLVKGGCSEEAAFLGILRVADEINFNYPKATIVIQGLLPWSRSSDGTLDPIPHGFHPLRKSKPTTTSLKVALATFSYWPSIQHINSELEKYCAERDNLVYFDVSELFLGSLGNKVYKHGEQQIIPALLYQGKRLSFRGYTILGKAIQDKLDQMISVR